MQIYLVTDKKKRVHQFIYPDRVWIPSDVNSWISRPIQKEDHALRLEVVLSLVKNSVSAQRLGGTQDEEITNHVIH